MALVRERIKTKKQEVGSVLLFVVVFFLGGLKGAFFVVPFFFAKRCCLKYILKPIKAYSLDILKKQYICHWRVKLLLNVNSQLFHHSSSKILKCWHKSTSEKYHNVSFKTNLPCSNTPFN